MPVVRYVFADGDEQGVEVPLDKSLMKAALDAGIEGIVGECGGQVMCATCHVYIDPRWADHLPAMSEDEEEMLCEALCPRTTESRLACQLPMTQLIDGIVVRLPKAQV